MNKTYLVTAITIIAVGAGAFYGGMQYQKSQTPQFPGAFGQMRNGQTGQARTGQFPQRTAQGFRPVNGEIIKQDETSITVKLQDGSSKIIMISETTAINKAEKGAKTDLAVGIRVAAFGKENSDGSITAENVQLNPGDRMMFGGR